MPSARSADGQPFQHQSMGGQAHFNSFNAALNLPPPPENGTTSSHEEEAEVAPPAKKSKKEKAPAPAAPAPAPAPAPPAGRRSRDGATIGANRRGAEEGGGEAEAGGERGGGEGARGRPTPASAATQLDAGMTCRSTRSCSSRWQRAARAFAVCVPLSNQPRRTRRRRRGGGGKGGDGRGRGGRSGTPRTAAAMAAGARRMPPSPSRA